MCYALKNVNQSDFALFVATLKILLKSAKELLTLIPKFIHISNELIFSCFYLMVNAGERDGNFRKNTRLTFFCFQLKGVEKDFYDWGAGDRKFNNYGWLIEKFYEWEVPVLNGDYCY